MKVIVRGKKFAAVEVDLYASAFRFEMSRQAIKTPFVVADEEYLFEIVGTAEEMAKFTQANFILDINGIEFSTYPRWREGRLFLLPYMDSDKPSRYDKLLPFIQAFGFVQLQIQAVGPSVNETYYSDYLQVALRDGENAQDLKAMARYVIENRKWFECSDKENQALFKNTDLNEAQARLRYFEKAIKTYESLFTYFNAHAKTRTLDTYRRDGFEKLRNFDAKTLAYVVSHPEELMQVRSNAGIALGGHFYAPKHTLVAYRTSTKDIAENRAIMAFLNTLQKTLGRFRDLLFDAAQAYGLSSQLPEGYVSSTDAVFEGMRADWVNLFKSVSVLVERLKKIHIAYERILMPVSETLLNLPRPSSLFTNEPHYRLFYELMAEGFNMKPLTINQDSSLLMMLANSSLYEYFALIELCEAVIADGYTLESSFHYHYAMADTLTFYSDNGLANTFVFKRGGTTYTLYYQPIISGKNGGHENGLHLKRITRLSFKEKESLTGVYVPDFVIKVEAKDEESYYIADAKFSSLSTVRRHYAKELAFKYLLTTRTTNPFANIRGLYVYYGKRYEGSDEPVSAWDLLDPEHDVNEPSFILQGLFPERQ